MFFYASSLQHYHFHYPIIILTKQNDHPAIRTINLISQEDFHLLLNDGRTLCKLNEPSKCNFPGGVEQVASMMYLEIRPSKRCGFKHFHIWILLFRHPQDTLKSPPWHPQRNPWIFPDTPTQPLTPSRHPPCKDTPEIIHETVMIQRRKGCHVCEGTDKS